MRQPEGDGYDNTLKMFMRLAAQIYECMQKASFVRRAGATTNE